MTTEAPGPHIGPHHFASCGEWRPRSNNHECTRCGDVCPVCRAWYARPGPAPVALPPVPALTEPVRAAVRPVRYGTATTDPLGRGEPEPRTRIPRRAEP